MNVFSFLVLETFRQLDRKLYPGKQRTLQTEQGTLLRKEEILTMSYAMRAAQIDNIDAELEDIGYKLDEIEEHLEYMEQGTEEFYNLLDEKEQLEQRKEQLEQDKEDVSSFGGTAWNNGL